MTLSMYNTQHGLSISFDERDERESLHPTAGWDVASFAMLMNMRPHGSLQLIDH